MRRFELATYALLIAITALRIGSTWRVFSQTIDEPVSLLAGYLWLSGKPSINPEHPPLPRILEAFPLWCAGVPDGEEPDLRTRINRMLLFRGRYVQNLALIRSGNLIYVVLAIVAVALWARRELEPPFALLATTFFASLPPVLAHGGLATTDMAACATFAVAIVALHRWLDIPSLANAILLGAAVGFGLISKFSFIPYFGAAAVAILLLRLRARPHLAQVAAGLATAIAIVLLIYRGDWHTFVDGIRVLRAHAKEGHLAYLFGQRSQFGWWYYFPIALFFKTPLPFLALAGLGFRWRHLDAIVAAALVLLIAMTTSINIGVRHILPIFPPLAILAGAGAQWLWQRRREVVVVLCAWMFGGTLLAHPDYIPWFNELALGHGERILADSNFDWGQDVLRLRSICRQRQIDSLAFAVFTGAPLDELGLPPRRRIIPNVPTTGWHAISETVLTAAGGENAYAYVTRHPMVCRAGKTIRLYYVK